MMLPDIISKQVKILIRLSE